MEAILGAIGSVLIGTFRPVFRSIRDMIKNRIRLSSNYEDLKQRMESLSELKQQLDDEDLQHHLPRTAVKDWERRVNKLKNEFDSVRSAVTANGNTIGASGCMCSLDCKSSNNIVQGLVEVKQLIEIGIDFQRKTVGVNPVPRPIEYTAGPSIEGQPTATANLTRLMNRLKRDDKAKIIGVWGMGGVGKTTLVQNLNNELNKDPTNLNFNSLMWVTVSRNASVESIQSKLAEQLGLPMNNEESRERVASCLYKKLKGKRFLLILDDVWEGIDLDAVGIPRPDDHDGSKIVLTTRDLNVCRQMSTDDDFEIGRLSPEEAWKLFSQKVGEEVFSDDQIRKIAEDIVKECGGLPLAIIAVGASLRKKREIALWKRALGALQKAEPTRIIGVEEKVYKPLKWSYDSLKDDKNLKSCFLFFCLFPEDFEINIDNLVRYWRAEGLLEEQKNYEQLNEDVIYIVDRLKDSCLLEGSFDSVRVKMHDVVRDVGIWIAKSSEDGCKSIISAGISETEISRQLSNCFNGVKRVSFMNSNIISLPDSNMLCPETFTLFLQGNESLHEVPNSFLQQFQMLRTLDLSNSGIKSLPDSILQLSELRALILQGCYKLSELPPLEALGRLQVLECSDTAITKLPDGFEKLTNLRQLNLSRTSISGKIPTQKFRYLRKLEVLILERSGIRWEMSNTNEGDAPFEDLLCLDQLIEPFEDLLCLDQLIDLRIDCVCVPYFTAQNVSWLRRIKLFELHVDFPRLDSYLFKTQDWMWLNKLHFSRDVGVGFCLVTVPLLRISSCEGIDLMLGTLVSNSDILGTPFENLKELYINECCIFGKPSSSEGCFAQIDLLPNLEELEFRNVAELESLSDFSNLLGLRLTKLKFVRVFMCNQLENLLTMDGTLQKLEKLEEIHIFNCENLTGVFRNASSDNVVPNLWSLHLRDLPALEGICKANVSWPSLEKLEVQACNILRKLPLGIQNAESIQLIKGEQDWWNELEWDSEDSKMCLQPLFIPFAEWTYSDSE